MTLIERHRRERIVLVGVAIPPVSAEAAEASLDELSALVDTAGADEAERILQRRDSPDPATFVGKGKAEELREISETVDADTVVFDDDLSPAQSRNLEKILGRTAIDRTAVILDIFAQHAHTQEGKAQVELALLRYRLPRLRGRGKGLSQQAGGIGTRGPGETQLEVDRRRLLRRATKLESDLKELTQNRRTQRKARTRSRLATVALVGYTNAGKSTLLNHLTRSDVLVEDRLFATVDPTTRRLDLPGGERVLVTDTVGFVRKLPHQLVEAFRSTLEEVGEADLLVHVVDAAAPDPEFQIDAVRTVLAELGADQVPELLAFNKADRLPAGGGRNGDDSAGDRRDDRGDDSAGDDSAGFDVVVKRIEARHPGSVLVSAHTGAGVDDLLSAIGERLRTLTNVVELVVPYDRGEVVAALHRYGEVLSEDHEDAATRLRVRLDASDLARFDEFRPGT
ncbi:MAG: GTPase HflX [Acidimicrobiales bacterium]